MLDELEKMTGAKAHQMFDLIVGTWTGAVIASMMGITCMGAREGLEVYREMGRKIFKRIVVEGVGGLIQHHSYYDNMVLEEVLKTYTGDTICHGPRRSPLCPSSPAWSPTRCSTTCSPTTPTIPPPSLPPPTPPPSPSVKLSWPAVQLLDISLREHPRGWGHGHQQPHPVGPPGIQAPRGKVAMSPKSR